MDLRWSLDALGAALAGAAVPRWQAPASTAVLDEMQTALRPLRLPDEVVQFWREVDVRSLRVEPYPHFVTPEFALTAWRQERADEAGRDTAPVLPLVLVGRESHDCLSVELDVADVEGGALFEWFTSLNTGFTRRHDSLAEWLAYIARLIDGGAFDRLRPRDDGPWLRVPDPAGFAAWDENRPAPAELPMHGRRIHSGYPVEEWPQHWQDVGRLDGHRSSG